MTQRPLKSALVGVMAAAGMALAASGAHAAGTGVYTISGVANGSFDGGGDTSLGFTFTSVADKVATEPFFQFIDPLVSTTVTLGGIGTFTVAEPTALGMTSGGEVALDQYEPDERNVIIFGVTPENLDHSFAPVTSVLTEIVGDVIPLSGNNTVQFDGTGATSLPVITFAGTVTGSIPEPATWAMMLCGFGGCGAALRSRRKVAAA